MTLNLAKSESFSKEEADINDLKKITKKFDLKTAVVLDLGGKGLSSVKGLHTCQHLKFLDLAKNNIVFLHFLKNLTCLQFLDLSANRIQDISDLRDMHELVQLKLEGNLINDAKQLNHLKGLQSLKYLSFKSLDGCLDNPVCKYPTYVSDVLSTVKSLAVLDYSQNYAESVFEVKNDSSEDYYRELLSFEQAIKNDLVVWESLLRKAEKKIADKAAHQKTIVAKLQDREVQLQLIEKRMAELNDRILAVIK